MQHVHLTDSPSIRRFGDAICSNLRYFVPIVECWMHKGVQAQSKFIYFIINHFKAICCCCSLSYLCLSQEIRRMLAQYCEIVQVSFCQKLSKHGVCFIVRWCSAFCHCFIVHAILFAVVPTRNASVGSYLRNHHQAMTDGESTSGQESASTMINSSYIFFYSNYQHQCTKAVAIWEKMYIGLNFLRTGRQF